MGQNNAHAIRKEVCQFGHPHFQCHSRDHEPPDGGHFGAYIGIEDGKIVSIERKPPAEAPKAIVDGTGMVAIPGLIISLSLLATASLRGFTDDLGNTEALAALMQMEAKMDSRGA